MERSAWPNNLSSSRKHEIKELLHGQNPATRLSRLLDAHSETSNNRGQPLFAEDPIVNVLRSFSNTLSLSSRDAESYEVLQAPTNACARSEVSEGSESINTPSVPRRTSDTRPRLDLNFIDEGDEGSTDDQQSILNSQFPRRTSDTRTRLDLNLIDEGHEGSTDDQQSVLNLQFPSRKTSDSITIVTTDLEEGHQWRKYGQRPILYAEFPRQYFRCGHKIDQGCQATKQVQKTEDGPPLYRITYRGHHTCKNLLVESPQLILDSPSPIEDDLNPSLIAGQNDGNNDPIFFDFLSVNQEQKLPSEDGLNPHGHSHGNNSSNHQSTTTNYFHEPVFLDAIDLEVLRQMCNPMDSSSSDDDGLNPHGHSHGNNSSNHQSTTTNYFHEPVFLDAIDLEVLRQMCSPMDSSSSDDDGLNPHGHSHGNNSSNHQSTTTNYFHEPDFVFHEPDFLDAIDLEVLRQMCSPMDSSSSDDDGLNPHGHSHGNNISNHQSTTTNYFHEPESFDATDHLEMLLRE